MLSQGDITGALLKGKCSWPIRNVSIFGKWLSSDAYEQMTWPERTLDSLPKAEQTSTLFEPVNALCFVKIRKEPQMLKQEDI